MHKLDGKQEGAAEKPLWRTLTAFLMPLMAANVLQSMSGTITSIYMGRLIGVQALAAMSAFFPFLFLILSFLIGISSASSVLIGQTFGARDLVRMRTVAGTTLSAGFLLGIIVGGIGVWLADDMLILAATPPDVLPEAVAYAKIVFYSMPSFSIFIAYTTFLRGTGDARTPFLALIVATVISVIATPALIQGWAGLPKLGVSAGAYAGLLSNVLTLVWLAVHLLRKGHLLAPNRMLLARLAIDWQILWTLVKIGVPTAFQVILISLSELAVITFVNAFGSQATAAYGAVNQVASFVQLPAISIGIAASVFGAQAIGRGDTARLREITKTALLINLVICAVAIGLVYIFSRTILGFFITEPDTLEIAQELVLITLWSYVLFGTTNVLSGIMRSSGTVLVPTTLSIAAIWLVEVPVAYFLSKRIGIDGIWIGYPAAFIVSLSLQATYFLLVWRKKSFKRLV
jgi:putative MATE family efflux protein